MKPMQSILQWDISLLRLINREWIHPNLDAFMLFVTRETLWGFVALIFLVYGALTRNYRVVRFLLVAVIAVVLVDAVCSYYLKPSIQRIRPCLVPGLTRTDMHCASYFGFPSNHAANGFAVAVLGLFWFSTWWKWVPLAGALLVAYSRVYLGVHYPTDILAGFAIGAIVALFVYFAILLVKALSNAIRKRVARTV